MTRRRPPALDTAEFRLVAATCAAAATDAPPPPPAQPIDAAAVQALADRHRLGAPVLQRLADALAGGHPAVAAALVGRARRQRVLALEQARQTAALSRLLGERDIRHLVVKGAALSQQLYGDVAARSSKDIDLLVDPARLADAGAALAGQGFARTDGEAGGPRRHRTHAAGAIQIELHDRLVDLPSYVPLGFAALWPRRSTVSLLGEAVPVMGEVDTLLHLAAHGSDHVWFRLKWLQDIARIVAIDPGGAVARADAAAREAGFDRVFAAMLRLVADLFGIVPADPALLRDDAAGARAVRLALAALAAPAELAQVPTPGWIVRRSLVQLGMRRDWRYRRDLLADLATGPRSFDPADRDAWSLLHLPARAIRFWRSRG